MKTKFWLILLLAAFMLGALANPQSDGTAALLRIENEFMKAAAEHGSKGYLSYYAEDAVEVPNGTALLQGKPEIAKTMGFLDSPDNHLTWTPWAQALPLPAIWATPTARTNFAPRIKRVSRL